MRNSTIYLQNLGLSCILLRGHAWHGVSTHLVTCDSAVAWHPAPNTWQLCSMVFYDLPAHTRGNIRLPLHGPWIAEPATNVSVLCSSSTPRVLRQGVEEDEVRLDRRPHTRPCQWQCGWLGEGHVGGEQGCGPDVSGRLVGEPWHAEPNRFFTVDYIHCIYSIQRHVYTSVGDLKKSLAICSGKKPELGSTGLRERGCQQPLSMVISACVARRAWRSVSGSLGESH